MTRETKNYKVVIFGEPYTLRSDDSEQHVKNAAELVDALMQKIAGKAKNSDVKNIAVLAALQLASNVTTLESESKAQTDKEKQLVDRLDQALNDAIACAQQPHMR